MGVHIYQNGTEKNLKNAYIGEYNTYTFDFQNNGDLGWTQAFSSETTITSGVDSGQGWYAKSTSSYGTWLAIQPPQSLYDGKSLVKITMKYYLPNTLSSFGLKGWNNSTTDNKMFRYRVEKTQGNQVGFTSTGTPVVATVGEYTGEITLEVSFTNNSATGFVNGTPFTISSTEAQYYLNSRNQNHLRPAFTIWGGTGGTKMYLRKIIIETN